MMRALSAARPEKGGESTSPERVHSRRAARVA